MEVSGDIAVLGLYHFRYIAFLLIIWYIYHIVHFSSSLKIKGKKI